MPHPTSANTTVRRQPRALASTGQVTAGNVRARMPGVTAKKPLKIFCRVMTYVHGGASTKCFLVIDYENQSYVGTLVSDDRPFCAHLAKLLRQQIGTRILHIGSLDIPAGQ